MNDDGQKIKIRIADRELSLKVKSPDDEAYFRRGAKDVNELLSQYKERYPGNSLSDFLSMIALIMAKKVHELKNRMDNDPLRGDIEDLSSRLKKYLEKDNIDDH